MVLCPIWPSCINCENILTPHIDLQTGGPKWELLYFCISLWDYIDQLNTVIVLIWLFSENWNHLAPLVTMEEDWVMKEEWQRSTSSTQMYIIEHMSGSFFTRNWVSIFITAMGYAVSLSRGVTWGKIISQGFSSMSSSIYIIGKTL